MVTKNLLYAGVVGPILFIVVFLLKGFTRPGYSQWRPRPRAFDSDPLSLVEQRLQRIKGRITGVEDAHPMVGPVDRVRHQAVEGREVMIALAWKQRRVRLLADPDVQSKDAGAVQMRRVVEIGVVLGHDGGERKAPRPLEFALRRRLRIRRGGAEGRPDPRRDGGWPGI